MANLSSFSGIGLEERVRDTDEQLFHETSRVTSNGIVTIQLQGTVSKSGIFFNLSDFIFVDGGG